MTYPFAERPTDEDVDMALRNTFTADVESDRRAEPYPHWCDDAHVLAAEVLALREQHQKLVAALEAEATRLDGLRGYTISTATADNIRRILKAAQP